jgi:prepilin-type N-terminal cleavage/methylation domain-containing protein
MTETKTLTPTFETFEFQFEFVSDFVLRISDLRSSAMTLASRQRRRGFTLVELLVVITIIGMLMAILVPTVFSVLYKAKNTRIALEIAALSQALEAYKNEAGDYPPNFNDAALVKRHIFKRWQQLQAADIAAFNSYCTGAKAIDPDEALAFWLGAQSPNGGLKANEISPLLATGGEVKRFFEFDQARLTDPDGDGWNEYAAPGCMNAPYVYFDSRSYAGYTTAGYDVGAVDSIQRGVVKPTLSTKGAYMNLTTYQIHASGQDGVFGTPGLPFPDGPYVGAERDNITNFSEGKVLGDAAQ